MRWSRLLASAFAVGALALLSDSASAGAGLPLRLQAQLVAKLGAFDRNFSARAGSVARVLVLQKPDDPESVRVATNIASGLGELHEVGGVPARIEIDAYPGATSLAERCRSQRIALVYISTGLDGELAATARALSGVDVLTVGATASSADSGTVVAFDLEEGRPKIIVHRNRAKAQHVDFKSELLKYARIVD